MLVSTTHQLTEQRKIGSVNHLINNSRIS